MKLRRLNLSPSPAKLALVAVLVLMIAALIFARNWHPSTSDYPQQGVEADETLGTINWVKAKADGVSFAYLHASSSDTGRDTRFADYWAASAEAGIRHGALHTFNLCRLARDQATNFIATVPREQQALPAAIDLDLDNGCGAHPARSVLIEEIATFIRMVEAHTEKPILIRVSRAFEKKYAVSRAIDRPLWLSSFFFTPSFGERPWIMWRANKSRKIDGIDERVGWSVVRP